MASARSARIRQRRWESSSNCRRSCSYGYCEQTPEIVRPPFGRPRLIPIRRLSLRKMYTYIAPIERIEQALRQTEDDLLDLFDRGVPVCGGGFPMETLEWLLIKLLWGFCLLGAAALG